MKRNKLFYTVMFLLLICLTISTTAFAKKAKKHSHNYNKLVKIQSEPTCTIDGYATYKCSCGATTRKIYKKALGHDWYKERKNGGYLSTKETMAAAIGQGWMKVPSMYRWRCSRCKKTKASQ